MAEYRPQSRGSVYRVDAASLEAIKQFQVPDHIGNILMDRRRNRLVGTTWALDGSLSGTGVGRQHRSLGQSLPTSGLPGRSVRRGRGNAVRRRNQPCPTSDRRRCVRHVRPGRDRTHRHHEQKVLHQVPFQQWSTAGRVATHNPFAMTADGDHLTIHVAPDDGDATNSAEILTYQATVIPDQPPRRRSQNR